MGRRRILVTGGAGFIGSNIVDLLIEEGFDVVVVDDLSRGKPDSVNPKARFYHCSITSDHLHEILKLERPECVIHHAAQIDVRYSVQNPAYDASINIGGSINLLEACRKNGVRKIVYASSAALYGDPQYLPLDEDHPILATSPYGISKHTVEHYLFMYRELYGLEYTVLRYANVYGPRQDSLGEGGVIAIFAERVGSHKACTIYGSGEQTRDFVYVEDVARANFLAIDQGDGMIFNVGCQKGTSVNELLMLLRQMTNQKILVEHAPSRAGDIMHSVLANDRIRQALGWEPRYDLASGLRRLIPENSPGFGGGNRMTWIHHA